MGVIDTANQLAKSFSDLAQQGREVADQNLGHENAQTLQEGAMQTAMGTLGPEGKLGGLVGKTIHIEGVPHTIEQIAAETPSHTTKVVARTPSGPVTRPLGDFVKAVSGGQ